MLTIALHSTLNISEMAHGVSYGHVTDDVTWPWKVKLVTPIWLERIISKTEWRCYLETIANYYLVCYEAVRSAILATAWLLVVIWHATNFPCWWKCVLKSSKILAKIARSYMSLPRIMSMRERGGGERRLRLADWDEWHIELHHCSSVKAPTHA